MKKRNSIKIEAAPDPEIAKYQQARVEQDALRRKLQESLAHLDKVNEEIEKRMAAHPKALYSPEVRDKDAEKVADAKVAVNEVKELMRKCDSVIAAFESAQASKEYDAALAEMEAAAEEIRPYALAAVEAAQTLLDSLRSMEPRLRNHESQRGNFDRARRKLYEIGSLDGEPLPPTVAPLHCQLPMDYTGFVSFVHKQLVCERGMRVDLTNEEIRRRYPALHATAAMADALPEED